jgi:hypothetical protein
VNVLKMELKKKKHLVIRLNKLKKNLLKLKERPQLKNRN